MQKPLLGQEAEEEMSYVQGIVIIAIMLVVLLGGSSVYNGINEFIQKSLYGPEYCFRDLDQSSIAIASQGIEFRYTKTEGDEACFRTKDFSLVEKINKQIQDRKLDAELARIEVSNRFWNETFPKLFIVGIIALTLIIIISYLGTGRNYGY